MRTCIGAGRDTLTCIRAGIAHVYQHTYGAVYEGTYGGIPEERVKVANLQPKVARYLMRE